MTNEERDIISQFIARVGGAQAQSGFSGGSVPAAQTALPPVDRDADSHIAQLFNQYPEARYRITQLAFVQEHALTEAQNRIKRLEWEVQQAQQAAQQAQQSGQRSGGGLFGGLFGGGRQQSAPPPGGPQWNQGAAPPPNYQQQYASPPPQYQQPGYQQGMFQRGGSGFLGSALTTAAGVAGGVVAGNALMDLFSPHRGAEGALGGGGNPWGGQGDASGWGNAGAAPGNQDYVDNGSWDQSNNNAGWSDNSGGGGLDQGTDNSGGGWDQSSDNSGGWDQGGGTDDTI